MKKVLLLLAVALSLLFAGCSENKEKKAKELINHQLKVTLHDFSSYESVEFGKLDSTFTESSDLPEYKIAIDKANEFTKQGGDKIETAKMYGECTLYDKQVQYARWGKELLDSATYYINIAKNIDSTFIPKFVGWNITHTFRANNASGNKVIGHRKYYFDKDVSKIINDENLDED